MRAAPNPVSLARDRAGASWLMRRGWVLACGAAVVATLGDIGQLWAVNAARPALSLPVPPRALVVAATLAGALAIPLYAVGYHVRARRVQEWAPRRAAVVRWAGAVLAVVGGQVHAVTGVLILGDVGDIAGGLDPLHGILTAGPVVLSLWGLATVALLCAAVAEACLAQAWALRLFNPGVATVLLGAAASLAPAPWPDFLGPAAPNLAHLLFFLRLGLFR